MGGISFDPLNTIIGGGFDLLGGYLDNEAQEKSDQKNRQHQDQVNVANADLQREFAKMGIRWKVEDAMAAGIHPLAALGASTQGAQPSHQAFVGSPKQGIGRAMSNIGQNITRSMTTTSTQEDKISRALQIKRMDLENQVLEKQLRQTDQIGPAMPSTKPFGQAIDGQSESLNDSITAAQIWQALGFRGGPPHKDRNAQETGYRPDVSYSQGDRAVFPQIPESLSESMEDDIIGKALWRVRNQIAPNFGLGKSPPKSDLPKGYDRWRWDPFQQGYVPKNGPYRPFKNFKRNRNIGMEKFFP